VTPLDFMIFVVSPPVLLMGLYFAYQAWRDDHPRKKHHPAE
jgi:hypothetical protein